MYNAISDDYVEEKEILIIQPTYSQAMMLQMSDYIDSSLNSTNENHATDKNIILNHGTRGGGKTDGVLWEIKQEIDKGFGADFKAIIFRINYKDLEDIVDKTENFFVNTLEYDCKMVRGAQLTLKFATGEKILFRIMRNINDCSKYHGHGYQFILFEECTLWKDFVEIMNIMLSCLRSPYNKKYQSQIRNNKKNKLIMKLRMTTNPYGVGKSVVKRRFIDNKINGKAYVENGITHINFFSSYIENPYIENSYILNFVNLLNKEMLSAYVFGDWNGQSSGCFGDLWKPEVFCLDSFRIPAGWTVNRSMDWGTAEPYSVLYWAESNGEEAYYYTGFNENKKKVTFCPPEGTLILLYEMYGNDKDKGANIGTGENASVVADKMLLIEEYIKKNLMESNVIEDGEADNSICADTGHLHTVEDLFNDKGIYWLKSDKSKGSRVRGVANMLNIMQDTIAKESSRRHLYVFSENCPNWISNVMSLERDPNNPEDVKTKGVPDHDWDATKYRLSGKLMKTEVNNNF